MDEIFSLLTAGTKLKKIKDKTSGKNTGGRSDINGKSTKSAKIDLLGILDDHSGSSESFAVEDEIDDDDTNDNNERQTHSSNTKHLAKNSELVISKNKKRFTSIEEVNAFRNKLQIKINGEKVPNPAATFQEMAILSDTKPVILHNIELSDWKEPTPIQMQAIPILLSGRDLLASAPTGSGKTAAKTYKHKKNIQEQTKIYKNIHAKESFAGQLLIGTIPSPLMLLPQNAPMSMRSKNMELRESPTIRLHSPARKSQGL